MGRYTQRRRAASSPAGVSALATILLTVTRPSASHLLLTFNRPIVLVAGGTGDENLVIESGALPASVAASGASAANLAMSADSSPGDAWELIGQPAWLTSIVVFPASGSI